MGASDNLMNSTDLLTAAACLALLILSLYHVKLRILFSPYCNSHCLNTDVQTIFGPINSYSNFLEKFLHYFPH